MRKFLVVNMNYLGDALLTTPALAALRRAHPDARIDTVVGTGAAAAVLQGNPDLDSVIARTARGSWARLVQLYRLLREGRYTDAVILPPLPAYAAVAWLARTPTRIGQAGRGMNRFLTHLRRTAATHMADAMLDTMPVPAEARPSRRRLTVSVERDAVEEAEGLLRDAGLDPDRPIVAVNVGATRPQKRWFAEMFAAAIDQLEDFQCVLIGHGAEDEALTAEVQRRTKRARPASLVGRTGIKSLAALLGQCAVLVSADSGPMHLATAVGTPTVALFGSTDPAVTGPYDGVSRALYKSLPCAPCGNHPTCGGRYDCLRAISPDEVALAVRALVRTRRGVPVTALPMVAGAAPAPPPRREPRGPGRAPATPPAAGGTGEIRRILIATKFRFIGDTLLAIPIFRAARAQWPEAHIALLTGKNARLLLQNNPYLDEIIEFDPYKRDRGFKSYGRLVRRLHAGRFDLCLALNRSFHSALAPWMGGVRLRAGFMSEGRGPLLNRPVPYDRDKSEVACYFDVLRAVAPDVPVNPALELWISPEERACAAQHLRGVWGGMLPNLRLVGIQPGASLPGKTWPADRFARVADALVASDPSVRIVVVGGPDEAGTAQAMLSCCTPETRVHAADFAGKLDLRASLALLSHLHLFVGNDTAVMHSAVALGVRTVALFGPTNPRKWGNYGPCHRVLESADGTMDSLAPAPVAAAARELLAEASLAPSLAHQV